MAMATSEARQKPRTLDSVLDILESLWGNEGTPPDLRHEEPLDGLILTLLSQNTNDKNRDKAFEILKKRFPSWDQAAMASQEELEDLIRPAGLSRTKSERMLHILSNVRETFGEYSLKKLRPMDKEAVREYLSSLPGIGAKTIACVLLFDLEKPAFPVDTHIARFCRRMEWVEESLPPDRISSLMEAWVPPARYLGGHVNIIEHGRGLCGARKPKCGSCPVAPLCPHHKKTGALP